MHITQFFITEKLDFQNKTKNDKGIRPVMQKFEYFNQIGLQFDQY